MRGVRGMRVVRCMCGLCGMCGMCAMACMSRMGITGRDMVSGLANMGGSEFTAAVVATIDDTLPEGVQRDHRFVVVHGRAAGHIVHIGVVHAGQRRQLPVDARCAQGRDQLADFDGACFHDGARFTPQGMPLTTKLSVCMVSSP